jgi:hypothetical protein
LDLAPYSYPGTPAFLQLEADVIEWCEAADRQAAEESSQSLAQRLVPKITSYLNGNQWPSRQTAYGSSRPVNNRMFRQYWDLVSLLTDGRPEPTIKVWDTQDGYSEIQSSLYSFLEIWGQRPDYQEAFQDIVGLGLLCRGIGKIVWNPELNGGMGDVQLRQVHPGNFATLGGNGSLDEAECVIETRPVTIASLRRRYGQLADLVEPDAALTIASAAQPMKPRSMSSAEWNKVAPHMKSVIGRRAQMTSSGGETLFPMAKERQYWLRDPAVNESRETVRVGRGRWSYLVPPGAPLFPRGRVIVRAGEHVMDDTCNSYYHARPPYVDFTPLRTLWLPEGMSLMGSQIGPQDIVNRIYAGLLETVKAGLIPTIITPSGAISKSDLDNIQTTISGGKLEFNALRTGGIPPKFRDQPQFSQLALPMLERIEKNMDQTTGSAAIDAAAQKQQIPSHDTMELIQNSRSSLVKVMGAALERFVTRGGQLVISDMLQFYSASHRVALLGEKGLTAMDWTPLYGTLIDGSMAPESFIRKFQFSVRAGSALTFRQDQIVQMAAILRRAGDLSRQNLFRAIQQAYNYNLDLRQNDEELLQEQMIKLKLAALAGAAQAKNKEAAHAGK